MSPGWLGSTQEKIEFSKEQQVLMKVITDAYNKHQIPQDVAKQLVRDRLKVFWEAQFIASESKRCFPAPRPVQHRGKLPAADRNGNKSSSSSGGVYQKYSRYFFPEWHI